MRARLVASPLALERAQAPVRRWALAWTVRQVPVESRAWRQAPLPLRSSHTLESAEVSPKRQRRGTNDETQNAPPCLPPLSAQERQNVLPASPRVTLLWPTGFQNAPCPIPEPEPRFVAVWFGRGAACCAPTNVSFGATSLPCPGSPWSATPRQGCSRSPMRAQRRSSPTRACGRRGSAD